MGREDTQRPATKPKSATCLIRVRHVRPYTEPVSGARADANAIWIVQFSGLAIHVLDYVETKGQPLGFVAEQLRDRGWSKAVCYLPHDGLNANAISGKTFARHLAEAGFDVADPLENQGSGAANARIEAVRRIMPRCWFNDDKTKAGRRALGFYHERRDPIRNVGLGPEHDWSSHAADAFGLMALQYTPPAVEAQFDGDINYPNLGLA